MTSLAWIEFYEAFQKFAVKARRYKFHTKALQDMEYDMDRMCPLPHSFHKEKEEDER